MKRLLLSASVMAILSTQVFACRQVVDSEVDRVLSRQQIINRLFGSRDYTISISETDIARSALQRATDELGTQRNVDPVEVNRFTKEKIAQNLNDVKNDHVHIGGGYYSTSNFQNDDFCVESSDNILVYPVQKERREVPNAFLPTTYRSNRIGVDLYRRVVRYVEDMHLDPRDQTRLIRHISPLSYILQQEIDLMMNGGVSKNGTMVRGIADRPRWVYDDGYAGMLNHVKSQINHHFDMLVLSDLRGLDRNSVAENLTRSLLDNGLSLLPGSAFRFGDRTYVLGTGHRGFLGIIHPDNGLLYPILADSRSKREQGETFPVGDMNLPQGFQANSFLNKQWDRLDDFVHLTKMNKNDQRRAKILLEPAGYMAQSLIRDMQPDFSRLSSPDFVDFLVLSFSEQQQRNFFNRLEPFLFANANISRELDNKLRSQIGVHAAMTEDLWPSRFSNRDRQSEFALQAVNYLLYQELKEKLTSAWPHRRSMFLEQEGERDNVLRLTQEQLRTQESEFNRVQNRLEESNRDREAKTRLIREKEDELNLAKETAKQEINQLRNSLDKALTDQLTKERNLQKVREDANREIGLAQEDVKKARANLLKAEKDLNKEKQSNKSILDKLQEELKATKDHFCSVEKDYQTRIKEAETLIDRAHFVVLQTSKDLIEKEEKINQLSEEKAKVESDNRGLLTTIEENTKAMSSMLKVFNEFKTNFANKQDEVIDLNHRVNDLNEGIERLKSNLAHSQKSLEDQKQQTLRFQKNVDELSADLKKYKGRVKELKSSLKTEKEVSRLAQEELQKKYEGLLQNAKADELDQLKLQHAEEVKELSKKFIALTEELEIVQRKRDEIEVLYEEADKREKEALLKLNKLQEKVNGEFLNLSAVSPNSSPVGKNFMSGTRQINLGSLDKAYVIYDIDEEPVSQKSDNTITTIKRVNTGEISISDTEDHSLTGRVETLAFRRRLQ